MKKTSLKIMSAKAETTEIKLRTDYTSVLDLSKLSLQTNDIWPFEIYLEILILVPTLKKGPKVVGTPPKSFEMYH